MTQPNTDPIFEKGPLRKGFSIATANTARDGTGTIEPIVIGGPNGTRVDSVMVACPGTATAGNIKFFVRDEGIWKYVDEISVTATTPSATVRAFSSVWTPQSGYMTLRQGQALGAATHNAETMTLHPEGGDY